MRFKTPKWLFSAVLAFGLVLILMQNGGREGRPDGTTANPTAEFEIAQKQSILQQDVEMTAQLCRQQCAASFRQALGKLGRVPAQEARRELADMKRKYPHMLYLKWIAPKAGGRPLESGDIPDHLEKRLRRYLDHAEQAAAAGRTYASPRIVAEGQSYLVLSEAAQNRGALVGVVRQSVVDQVAAEERKNLRLVPYPEEGRYQMESVDSKTGRDIHVDSGEENAGASHYHKYQAVVKFAERPGDGTLEAIRRETGAALLNRLGDTYVFESRTKTAEELLAYFRARRDVQFAEPHYLYMSNESDPAPNDQLFRPYQWNLPITETIAGWNISKGSGQIKVAVLDTGVDLNHVDLQGRLAEGYNVFQPDAAPMDDVGHGTHVAGIISALVNNGEGVAGMNWYDAVMPVKVLDETGAGSTYSVAQGIIWATDNGAKVINMSLGNYTDAAFLHDAVRYAFERDVVLVAASGNDNTGQPGYPAAYPEVFAVAATDHNMRRAPFSNYGDYIDAAAPGVGIASTYPGNQYAALSGTSMASPHVAALAALIRSADPSLTNTEVMDIMRGSAIDLGIPGADPQYGYGQINVVQALQQAANIKNSDPYWPEWIRRSIERIRAWSSGRILGGKIIGK